MNHFRALGLALLGSFLVVLLACQTSAKHPEAHLDPSSGHLIASTGAADGRAGTNAPESNLLQTEADARAAAISNPAYLLHIDLDESSSTFGGKLTASFELKAPSAQFLDFQDGAKISAMTINGAAVDKPDFSNHRLQLPATSLKAGPNQVEIAYRQTYSHSGRGLHRFADPEDQRVYVYSQFEAFDAHNMFPCFDQPDLKATMKLTVSAPHAWEVISTTREASKIAAAAMNLWTFPVTPKISTYLFALHAGPYQQWQSNAGAIPLRLFARQTLARYIRPADWFIPTQQGLKFYGRYFAFPYPFKKYDQIVAPDFNAGAMENVAAITFSERYLQRGVVTREDRERLASVILHEMAHMWFGDLVTMHWWNGLWLNESFATFMSALAQDQATEFKESWQSFHDEKRWAYWEDQLVTTHPIEGPVPDTDSAFTNFDGITYGKGASVLKQLRFYLGDTAFRDGVRYYFKTHAYANTRLVDFIGALEHASHKDLSGWSDTWLRQAGLDTALPAFACKNGKISTFALMLHGPANTESPRSHRTQIALYLVQGGALTRYKTVDVKYQGAQTEVRELQGQNCPDLVDANDQDQDYAKATLDPHSLETAQSKLGLIKSPFVRERVWSTLFEMVQDAQLAPQAFLKTAEANLKTEHDIKVAENVMKNISSALYFLPNATVAQQATHLAWTARFEKLYWDITQAAPAQSDWQNEALSQYTNVVQTAAGRDQLLGLLQGKLQLTGLTLDPDQRWSMIERLSALGDARVAPILANERLLDKSERGVEQAMAADGARPVLERKRQTFQQMVGPNDLPFARQRAILRNVLPSWQDGLRDQLADAYYDTLPKLIPTKDSEFLRLFTSAYLPATCTSQSVQRLDAFIQAHEGFPPTVAKTLKVGRQEDARCVSARELSAKSAP